MGKDLKGKELGKGLSQRKDGTYMARFVDRYGKRKTFYGKNISELKRKLNKERYQSEYGFYGSGSEITLNEWFEEFLKLYKEGIVKETTLYRIRQTYAVCKRGELGMMKLRNITVNYVQKIINEMRDNDNTYGTINLFNNLLKQMFAKAIGNGYMHINPCDGVVLPKKTRYEARYLTEQEQQMFLETAKDYYHYDIFCANLSLGARIGDDDDKIRLNQRKPSKYKGLSRFGPEKNLQRINKFMKERPTFYKKLIQMKENFRFYLRCFYCITKVVILQFNSEKQDRISS